MQDEIPAEQMSENELWIQLGRELTQSDDHALPLDPRELIARAKAWFAANKKTLEDRICTVRMRTIADGGDNQVLIIAVGEVISACCVGVSPVTVTCLIIRKGLKKFCARHWKC